MFKKAIPPEHMFKCENNAKHQSTDLKSMHGEPSPVSMTINWSSANAFLKVQKTVLSEHIPIKKTR